MVTVSINMAWLLLLFVWIVIYARKLMASMRYGVTSTSFVYESGWLVKHRTFVPIEKVQSIELSDSPFDRRNKMKSVEIDVAGLDSNQHHINIKYLDEQHAQHLYESWNDKVCATSYRWK